jgi:hypothetical protein
MCVAASNIYLTEMVKTSVYKVFMQIFMDALFTIAKS